jgi:hypothetical protein
LRLCQRENQQEGDHGQQCAKYRQFEPAQAILIGYNRTTSPYRVDVLHELFGPWFMGWLSPGSKSLVLVYKV